LKDKRDQKHPTSQVQVVNLCRAVNTLPIVDEVEAVSAAAVVGSSVAAAVVGRLPSTKTKGDKKSEAVADTVEEVEERFAAVFVDVGAGDAVVVAGSAVTRRKAVAAVSEEDVVHTAADSVAVDAVVAVKAAKREPANRKAKRAAMTRTADVVADAVAVDAVVAVVDAEDLVVVPVPKNRAREARIKAEERPRLLLTGRPRTRSEEESRRR